MKIRFEIPALLLLLLIAGCDSGEARTEALVAATDDRPLVPAVADGANADPGDLPLPQPPNENQIGVRLSEYTIEMTKETLPAGELEFHVVNAGTTIHYLLIRSDEVYEMTRHLPPGESDTLRITLEPGEYQYLCTIRDEYDHYSEGMRGHIVVQ